MGKSVEDVIEACVEPLYLAVGGTTLDRMRIQIRSLLEMDVSEIGGRPVLFGVFDDEVELAYGVDYGDVLTEYNDCGFGNVFEGEDESTISTHAVTAAHRVVYGQAAQNMTVHKGQPAETMESTQDTAVLTQCLHELARRKTIDFDRPGHAPVVFLIRYATLHKAQKIMFSVVWRRL